MSSSFALLVLWSFWQVPPPMLSQSYAESLRDLRKWEEADRRRFEAQLQKAPEDAGARLKLMAYLQRADRAAFPADRAQRLQLAQWLIERHPESEILRSPLAAFSPDEVSRTELRRAIALWEAAAKAHPGDGLLLWNAASFFRSLDADQHLNYLEACTKAGPNHPFALRPLAYAYAKALFEGSVYAARAEAALEASRNVWVLGNAANMLHSFYGQSVPMNTRQRRAEELAERYFLRAKAIDPKLERAKILPPLAKSASAADAAEQERERQNRIKRFAEAATKIQMLPMAPFKELPPAIARLLSSRGCRVPQAAEAAARSNVIPRNNVISGQFFRKGEIAWAVLCSIKGSSSILVFQSEEDQQPAALATGPDAGYLQGLGEEKIGYSRQIRAVGATVILGHYRAYGGRKPPPIDHEGIDDAFLGKASVTWYFYKGKWKPLQGAD
jgi:hypothetical protein